MTKIIKIFLMGIGVLTLATIGVFAYLLSYFPDGDFDITNASAEEQQEFLVDVAKFYQAQYSFVSDDEDTVSSTVDYHAKKITLIWNFAQQEFQSDGEPVFTSGRGRFAEQFAKECSRSTLDEYVLRHGLSLEVLFMVKGQQTGKWDFSAEGCQNYIS